jgi:type IV pilus assembly protein PilM
MNPFSRITGAFSHSYLGIDIGTTAIKAVEVHAGKELPAVTNYAAIESRSHLLRQGSAIQTSSLKMFDNQVADLLKALLDKMQPQSRETIASLSTFNAFTTVIDFPDMAPAELGKAIQFQAAQYIPVSLKNVKIDWLKVGEYEDDKGFKHQHVLLISVPNEQIARYQNIFSSVGLTLNALEIETLSLVRSAIGPDQTPTLLLDIGSRSTNIIFTDKGQLLFSAQSDYASTTLTQALAQSLSINPIRAEELKRERGIIAEGPQREIATIMLPMLDAIVSEVKKAMYTYESRFAQPPKIERVLLAGGGSLLVGLDRYIADVFKLPTARIEPFVRFEYPATLEPILPELNPTFGVALGLTLRQF